MTHLSSDQMFEWILGERKPDVERHLEACSECHREIVGLQSGLLTFKQSVHECAGQPAALPVPHAAARRGNWGWAAVSAAAMGAVLLPLYIDVRQAQHNVAGVEDSLLLDEVNTRLARTVPQSMEHLLELMNEGKEGPNEDF